MVGLNIRDVRCNLIHRRDGLDAVLDLHTTLFPLFVSFLFTTFRTFANFTAAQVVLLLVDFSTIWFNSVQCGLILCDTILIVCNSMHLCYQMFILCNSLLYGFNCLQFYTFLVYKMFILCIVV